MRVGIIGTGAVAALHARAYRNLGFSLVACSNASAEKGIRFAAEHGAEFFFNAEELCRDPRVEMVDLCTLPNFRLPVVELCARYKKHLLVEKPIATELATARKMVSAARAGGIQLGVISQRRFDDAVLFLRRALAAARLGRILQADAYVKWYRSPEYFARPIKGSWAGEGGGALINQGIHYADLLLHLAGPIDEVAALWQLGGLHAIESEDNVSALLRYASGATGVLQASTAFWPGYPERIEIHGSNGTAILTGDRLTTWDLRDDPNPDDPPPGAAGGSTGASQPLALSTVPFERQLADFAEACRSGRAPAVSGEEGCRALALVEAIYKSSRANGRPTPVQR
jgi:predicted dehydrogenase